ncbi:hypothetical protein [Amycolatopsis sp. H20-H5]|uniref:hypothetical protein n=1 Tax=Amycolatopsis sp. H20-H5 TaxID=3046309 RepID=UPI002DBD5CDB|nr:hypothetical protein [Amycolatopsis sp. H20-H5]MEC3976228.1 hypothetical protein [Amycolatopsis sp. H20-H5]
MTEPVRMSVKTITALTDAASALFRLLYDMEQAQKAAATERLRTELQNLDLFRNDTRHEEPDEWR